MEEGVKHNALQARDPATCAAVACCARQASSVPESISRGTLPSSAGGPPLKGVERPGTKHHSLQKPTAPKKEGMRQHTWCMPCSGPAGPNAAQIVSNHQPARLLPHQDHVCDPAQTSPTPKTQANPSCTPPYWAQTTCCCTMLPGALSYHLVHAHTAHPRLIHSRVRFSRRTRSQHEQVDLIPAQSGSHGRRHSACLPSALSLSMFCIHSRGLHLLLRRL